MMMPTRHQFSAFAPENTPLLRENQYNYLRFNFLNPPVHYPRTHDSNIPEFQHSNCERSELTCVWWEWLPATIERVIAVKNRSHNPKSTDTKLPSFFLIKLAVFLASGGACMKLHGGWPLVRPAAALT